MNNSTESNLKDALSNLERTYKNIILSRKFIIICLLTTLVLFIFFTSSIESQIKDKHGEYRDYYTCDLDLYSSLLFVSALGIVLIYYYNSLSNRGMRQYHYLLKSIENTNKRLDLSELFVVTFGHNIDNYESMIYLPFTNRSKSQVIYIFVFLLFILLSVYLKIHLNLLSWYEFKEI